MYKRGYDPTNRHYAAEYRVNHYSLISSAQERSPNRSRHLALILGQHQARRMVSFMPA